MVLFWVEFLKLGFVGMYLECVGIGGKYVVCYCIKCGFGILIVNFNLVFYCYWDIDSLFYGCNIICN